MAETGKIVVCVPGPRPPPPPVYAQGSGTVGGRAGRVYVRRAHTCICNAVGSKNYSKKDTRNGEGALEEKMKVTIDTGDMYREISEPILNIKNKKRTKKQKLNIVRVSGDK